MDQDHAEKQPSRFVAANWERESAAEFLKWMVGSGEAEMRAVTLGQAVRQVWRDRMQRAPTGELARMLPEVLKSCDSLSFSEPTEAVAYAGLHLLDRYGRVMQVLEHLLRIGRLPLRRRQVTVLEVGSGPAPALYAALDFYAMLGQWPGRNGVQVALVGVADSLERGTAWDWTLHYLSEQLILQRRHDPGKVALPFRREIQELAGYNPTGRYHAAVAQRARSILYEFYSANEYLDGRAALKMAYGEGVRAPSAYDLVFLCNFLTQEEMTRQFKGELLALANTLTPGGVLIVMGGVGSQYPAIYESVRAIAAQARLLDISRQDAFDPNRSPQLERVRDSVVDLVAAALRECDRETASSIEAKLPKDLVHPSERFKLPRYQVLAFVNQRAKRR
jgi:hypothetical protein